MSEKPEVRWQAKITSLKEGILMLYENKEFCDVVFTIKGEHSFSAHKLVLSARSSVFARMLMNTHVPDEIIIEENSISATGFEILLRFIYTDMLGTEERKSIIEAYLAAQYYQQRALMSECDRRIDSWAITKDDVCRMLDAGLTITRLRDRLIAFIKDNASDVLFSPSFLEISLRCLNTILDSGALNSVPVLQRINRVMEWAAKRHTENVDYALVREEFLSSEPPLLRKLEFETLTLENLALVVKTYKGLLTGVEVMKFMEYYNDKDASVLPDWCISKN